MESQADLRVWWIKQGGVNTHALFNGKGLFASLTLPWKTMIDLQSVPLKMLMLVKVRISHIIVHAASVWGRFDIAIKCYSDPTFFDILSPHHIPSRVHALTAEHLQFTTGCGSGRGRIWRQDVLTMKQVSDKGKVQCVDSREPLGTVLHRL